MIRHARSNALMLAFALALPAAAVAQASDSSQPALLATEPAPARLALATQLVDLMHPDDKMVQSNLQGWAAISRRSALADPVMSKLEAEYPGVIEAAIENSRPYAVDYARDYVRKGKAMKSRLFAERMTERELRQITDFFSKPAGRRLAEKMQTPSEQMVDVISAKSQNEEALTENDLQGLLRSKSKTAIESSSADDALELIKFESLPAARKFGLAGQEADRMMLKIANNPDPDWLEKQRKARIDGAVRFIEAKRKASK